MYESGPLNRPYKAFYNKALLRPGQISSWSSRHRRRRLAVVSEPVLLGSRVLVSRIQSDPPRGRRWGRTRSRRTRRARARPHPPAATTPAARGARAREASPQMASAPAPMSKVPRAVFAVLGESSLNLGEILRLWGFPRFWSGWAVRN